GIEELLPAIRAGHGVALLLESARHRAGKRVKFLPLRPNPERVPVGVIYNVPATKLILKSLRVLDDTVPLVVRRDRRKSRRHAECAAGPIFSTKKHRHHLLVCFALTCSWTKDFTTVRYWGLMGLSPLCISPIRPA